MSDEATTTEPTKKARRGFAAMPRETQRRIASAGGKAAHVKGTAHEFSRETARTAGRKGGIAAQANRRARATTEPAPPPSAGSEQP